MITIDTKEQKKHRPILLYMKIPPPYGGGELRCAALCDYVSDNSDFIVQKISSPKRNKTNQGRFAFWKISDFTVNWWRFVSLIRRHKPSLIFCPLAKSFPVFLRDSFFYWTARFYKVPFVSELAGSTFYFLGKGRFQTWYGKCIISRLYCLRVLGKTIAYELARFGVTNIIITDNGIKCEAVQNYCDKREDGVVRLIFMGTHSPQKGFDQLVEASVSLARKGLCFEIHALGEWSSDQFREKIFNTLRENCIERRFVFHGLVHGQEKWSILSNSQILVLPSLNEGQPLVILEALACGVPVVASRVGAVPDTIESGINGLLISPGSSNELAESLEYLMVNPKLLRKMSKANLKLYKERFRQETFLQTQVAWIRACASGELAPEGQVFTVKPSTESSGN